MVTLEGATDWEGALGCLLGTENGLCLALVVISQVCAYVKFIHLYLRLVHFTVYQLYLNTKEIKILPVGPNGPEKKTLTYLRTR